MCDAGICEEFLYGFKRPAPQADRAAQRGGACGPPPTPLLRGGVVGSSPAAGAKMRRSPRPASIRGRSGASVFLATRACVLAGRGCGAEPSRACPEGSQTAARGANGGACLRPWHRSGMAEPRQTR
jgi:hypothetical protein